MFKFLITAHAESASGAAGYQRAVARQYANEFGVGTRAANSAVRQMANGRTPFQPSRGRNASGSSVMAQARRLANR